MGRRFEYSAEFRGQFRHRATVPSREARKKQAQIFVFVLCSQTRYLDYFFSELRYFVHDASNPMSLLYTDMD